MFSSSSCFSHPLLLFQVQLQYFLSEKLFYIPPIFNHYSGDIKPLQRCNEALENEILHNISSEEQDALETGKKREEIWQVPLVLRSVRPVKGQTWSVPTLMLMLTENKLNTSFPFSTQPQKVKQSLNNSAFFVIKQRRSLKLWTILAVNIKMSPIMCWFSILMFDVHHYIWIETSTVSWTFLAEANYCAVMMQTCLFSPQMCEMSAVEFCVKFKRSLMTLLNQVKAVSSSVASGSNNSVIFLFVCFSMRPRRQTLNWNSDLQTATWRFIKATWFTFPELKQRS